MPSDRLLKTVGSAVYPVCSGAGADTTWGSSFVVSHDSGSSYLVTCAHVVRDVGESSLQINEQPARVIAYGSPDGADDLAVLATDRLQIPAMRLAYDANPGQAVAAFGVRRIRSPSVFAVEPVSATLASRTILTKATDRVEAWRLRVSEGRIYKGYSGSPVVDLATGKTVGVAAYQEGNEYGIAIAAQELRRLWPEGVRNLDASHLTFAGFEFCYVPAGLFNMGTPEPRARELAEHVNYEDSQAEIPDHMVNVGDFYLARLPVTNRQYAEFIDATGRAVRQRRDEYSLPYSWDPVTRTYPSGKADFPVVLVSWHDAHAYSSWVGARLPTEAEWEKAARGVDRRTWPWGEDWDERRCNTGESGRKECMPVGAFSPDGDSPYGVADLSGNVWEWCSSIFAGYPYRLDSREDLNALGERVLRGGAWGNDMWAARCAARRHASAYDFGFTIGFRLALDMATAQATDRHAG